MSINLIEIMIMFMIILILVSYLIGISLRNMIDDRLSKVSLKLTKTKLIVEINKDDVNNEKIKTYYDDEKELNNKNTNKLNYIEKFENKKNEENDIL